MIKFIIIYIIKKIKKILKKINININQIKFINFLKFIFKKKLIIIVKIKI